MQITGAQPWAWQDSTEQRPGPAKFAANGSFADNLAFADRDKERTFIDSITSGPAHNQIAAGVETALSCMLGRMAGYQHAKSPGKSCSPTAKPTSSASAWNSSRETSSPERNPLYKTGEKSEIVPGSQRNQAPKVRRHTSPGHRPGSQKTKDIREGWRPGLSFNPRCEALLNG